MRGENGNHEQPSALETESLGIHPVPPFDGQATPPRGASCGPFLILEGLGAGGMGLVLAAYDPQLDRRVALKLLLPGGVGLDGGERAPRAPVARGPGHGPPVPPQRGAPSTRRRLVPQRSRSSSPWSSSRASTLAACASLQGAGGWRRARWRPVVEASSWPPGAAWPPRTPPGSSTATSSPTTCSSGKRRARARHRLRPGACRPGIGRPTSPPRCEITEPLRAGCPRAAQTGSISWPAHSRVSSVDGDARRPRHGHPGATWRSEQYEGAVVDHPRRPVRLLRVTVGGPVSGASFPGRQLFPAGDTGEARAGAKSPAQRRRASLAAALPAARAGAASGGSLPAHGGPAASAGPRSARASSPRGPGGPGRSAAAAIAVAVPRGESVQLCSGTIQHLTGVWDAGVENSVKRAFLGSEQVDAREVFDRVARRLGDSRRPLGDHAHRSLSGHPGPGRAVAATPGSAHGLPGAAPGRAARAHRCVDRCRRQGGDEGAAGDGWSRTAAELCRHPGAAGGRAATQPPGGRAPGERCHPPALSAAHADTARKD